MFEKYIILKPINVYTENTKLKYYSENKLKKKMVQIVYNDVKSDYNTKENVDSLIMIANKTIKGSSIPFQLGKSGYFYTTSKERYWYQKLEKSK